MSPPAVAAGPLNRTSNPKEDVWALGIIGLELALGTRLWPHLRSEPSKLPLLLEQTLSLATPSPQQAQDPLQYLKFVVKDIRHFERLASLPEAMVSLLHACLTPKSSQRPTPVELLSHPAFGAAMNDPPLADGSPFPWLRSSTFKSPTEGIQLEEVDASGMVPVANRSNEAGKLTQAEILQKNPLRGRPLKLVHFLWTLAGGDLEAELVKQKIVRTLPPILRLPSLVRLDRPELGVPSDPSVMLDLTTHTLDTTALSQRLRHADLDLFCPAIPLDGSALTIDQAKIPDAQSLELKIRERDLDYQFHRAMLMQRLLAGCPYTRPLVVNEAAIDVPPFVRAEVWAELLDVPASTAETYKSADNLTETPTDRQIDVDIPRCHQYDLLLSSPTAHLKFRRVLKAWMATNPDLVYWQGLDSLCAPFLKLNFNNEAMAYGCLNAFIHKYLNNFFKKDNSVVMQEYLAVFSHLVAYHDPAIAYHLEEIGFIADLFAIPWFLTCFAHVFPLEKIFHLWDGLLLGNSGMTVCVGVAVLVEQRDALLAADFDVCSQLFSDAPDVDVERCVQKARELYDQTPPSLAARQFSMAVNESPPADFEFPPIATLKSQVSPTMSLADFLDLYNAGRSQSEERWRSALVLVVDVRSASDYAKGHLASCCLNVPIDSAVDEQGQLTGARFFDRAVSNNKHIVIVANRGKSGPQYAQILVERHIPHVSVLSGGASALRRKGLLTKITQVDPSSPPRRSSDR